MALSFVLDTNIILYHLGNRLAQDLPDGPLCISVISEIELLSYPGLATEEEQRIDGFLNKINVIDLTEEVKRAAISMRKAHKLKLPDAIVAATAKALGATLITNDAALSKIAGLKVVVPPLSP